MTAADADPIVFEAMIAPHRSLSRRGRLRLCAGIFALVGTLGLRFLWLGAWPVAAFGLVEIGLAVFLLWLNTARGRASEMVLLTERGLRIVRTDWRGRRRECAYDPAWLSVVLSERPGQVPVLTLAHRGLREEIGGSLGDAEKRDLAQALRDALHAWRNPRFDNPALLG